MQVERHDATRYGYKSKARVRARPWGSQGDQSIGRRETALLCVVTTPSWVTWHQMGDGREAASKSKAECRYCILEVTECGHPTFTQELQGLGYLGTYIRKYFVHTCFHSKRTAISATATNHTCQFYAEKRDPIPSLSCTQETTGFWFWASLTHHYPAPTTGPNPHVRPPQSHALASVASLVARPRSCPPPPAQHGARIC